MTNLFFQIGKEFFSDKKNKSRFLIKWQKLVVVLFCTLLFTKPTFSLASDGTEKSYFSVLAGSSLVANSSPLVMNATATLNYPVEYEQSKEIKNIISLSLFEEIPEYIPGNFSATVKLNIEYGHTSGTATSVIQVLAIDYNITNGVKYNAKNYFSFTDAEYVKITVLEINAPTVGTFDTKKALIVQNEMRVIRFYELKNNALPTSLSSITPFTGDDELVINWLWPADAGNTHTQIEWTWIEDELLSTYTVNNTTDYELMFKNRSTRIDVPVGFTSYNIPLLYGGQGKLFYRIRAVNIKSSGNRSDGPWSSVQSQAFSGHNNSLNWQSTMTFAEDGKRKVVMQYYDGSLRYRQTVTKENVTNTTVTAETFYDGQGRAAIQILPTPGINNTIAYTKNLNLFNGQSQNQDPVSLFDLEPVNTPNNFTPSLQTVSGSSKYYSSSNPEINADANKNIPDAEGYPYTVIRYTPDATGRIMAQSGVGAFMKIGSGHEIKYYYGSPSQEELDGLFGTEAGDRSHYFKNMVKDANEQMSVSYVDMHGRTIATALAGDAPPNMTPLDLANQYPGQTGSLITRNLLNDNTNTIKNNSLESINSLLVPVTTTYQFRYELNPDVLQLLSCTNTQLCYDCMYDLELTITDESGETPQIVKKFNNVNLNADDNCTTPVKTFEDNLTHAASNIIQFSQTLPPGSYSIRKTLTISEASLLKYKEQFTQIQKGLCKTEQQLIDSIETVMLSVSDCNTAPVNQCIQCNIALGSVESYRTNYLNSIGNPNPVSPQLESEIVANYNQAKLNCDRLCDSTSQTLATKRSLMLSDMMPYSGQYATDGVPAESNQLAMYNKYNIFSTANSSTQPFYKKPWNSNKILDFYYTDFHVIDPAIHPDGTLQLLNNTSNDDFTSQFNYSWAESLLPHHPEYDRLVFAETNLTNSYNWMHTFNSTSTYAQASTNGYIFVSDATLNDPFYSLSGTSTLRSTMVGYIANNYKNGLSMWQIAYGNVMCKTILSSSKRDNCYQNGGIKIPPYNNLTSAQKDEVWMNFRNFYSMERDNHVNSYIASNVPLSDAQSLVNAGYILRFPDNNNQMAQQFGNDWSWYPVIPGDPPNLSNLPGGSTSSQTYSSRCNSYITQWKLSLEQCPSLANHPNKEQILNQITSAMVTVCEKGSDAANPYGSSNVAPGTPFDGSPRSFEKVIDSVFAQYNISRTNLCNPYVIEYPKPYGKGPVFIKEMATIMDTCNCERFTQLKNDALAAAYNPNNFTSFNQYLFATYGDTLTTVLYNELSQNCHLLDSIVCTDSTVKVLINCSDTATISGSYRIPENNLCYKDSTFTVCDSTETYFVLSSPQPMPEFLKCGFFGNLCLDCAELSRLTSEFKSYFPSPYNGGPHFSGTDLDSAAISDNILFQKFLNYKTGYQYTWMEYAQKAMQSECNLANYVTNSNDHRIVICPGNAVTDTAGYFVSETPCQRVHHMAVALAQQIYQQRIETLLANFDSLYRKKCLAAKSIEQFTVTYTNKEYHYTLYYYDMAGNLVKTVPPKGVRPDFSASFLSSVNTARASNTVVTPSHELMTNYRYNSLNQVIAQNSPDANTSKFWYDKLGRLVISQNAQQELDNKYSYTLYDALGRIMEVGQKPQTSVMTQTISQDPDALNNWLNANTGTKEQITFTVYDLPYAPLIGTYMTQKNLRNRVSYVGTKQLATDADHYMASYYTYDVHGNVDTLLQDYKGITEMDASNNRFKLVVYNYDLISGKVNNVLYQPTRWDAFYHRYQYDAENRLVEVKTSRDSIVWETDATYSYYKYGPLSRTVLGQLQVQGQDYSYTIQGWLKGINTVMGGGLSSASGNCDAGTAFDDLVVSGRTSNAPAQYIARNSISFEDGFISGEGDEFETLLNASLTACTDPVNNLPFAGESFPVAKDAYGFSLHFYTGDYKPIGLNTTTTGILGALGSNASSLFNGNIAAMSVNIPKLGNAKVYNYHYDQLNRIVQMDVFNGLNTTTGTFTPVQLDDYKERISYDPNGNILTYLRNGTTDNGKPLSMDNLSYSYYQNTNQLKQVTDAVSNNNYLEDIDNQTNATNYTYDKIGNLRTDAAEGITGGGISWTVYGKIASIVKNGTLINYSYDAAGNRISKTANNITTIYVRDAQGNVLGVYEKPSTGNLKKIESHLYGSSRLGLIGELSVASQTITLSSGFNAATLGVFTRGERVFELNNHLGNVLVTVSDKKLGVDQNSDGVIDYYTADVLSATDYYPFGLEMPNRTYTAHSYRYSFNGKEDDKEASNGYQDYGMREYDKKVGRFISVDPLTKKYPELTPYQFASNTPIQAIDLDGAESMFGWGKDLPPGAAMDVAMGWSKQDAKIVNGTASGVKKAVVGTWKFITSDAWKGSTWRNIGSFLEEGALDMSTVKIAPSPRIDAAVQNFKDKVINGDAYSRSEYFAEFGTNMLLGYLTDKGIGALSSLPTKVAEGMSLVQKMTTRQNFVLTKYASAIEKYGLGHIDWTNTVSEAKNSGNLVNGKRLVQWREPGNPNASPFFTYEGVDPSTLGIPKTYTQKYYAEFSGEQTFLQSTANKVKAFSAKDPGVNGMYNGGGRQLYSQEAAKTAKFIPAGN